MAGGVSLKPPAAPGVAAAARRRVAPRDLAWLGVAVVLAALAVAGAASTAGWAGRLDWQPARVWTESWRLFSPVAVHYSPLHLAANLLGTLLVGALGWAAQLPPRCAVAWLLAWPLTHAALLAEPTLHHYGGLSGVLHAAVAITGVHLCWRAAGFRRAVGAALLAVLALKVAAERPWGEALRQPAGWDIALAPLAHATGAAAGLACGMLAELWAGWRTPAAAGRCRRGPQ